MTSIPLGPFTDSTGYEQAIALDASDPLATFRDRFVHTDPDLIYLDGNSLGRLPVGVKDHIDSVVDDQWGDRLIRSWNDSWWDLQVRLGDMLAPIVGSGPGEVIISDSTSVNLYKLVLAAVRAMPGRSKIVTDDLNFPTDVYILEGIARQAGLILEVVESDGINGPLSSLAEAIDEDTALVSLSHTVFKSGYTYDMAFITRMAHEARAMVLWDCSHSVGAVPIDLNGTDVDLAVGCTYKYLNGGLGSPAFLYVRPDLQDKLENPITAWWGHADPFQFDISFEPATGIRRFHTGTMPILSLAAMEAGISDVLDAGTQRLRHKSLAMSEYLISEANDHLLPLGFGIASPHDSERRGSHVSLSHDEAWPITRATIEEASILPDFRTPDNLRLGLAPLYNSFLDIHTAVQRIRAVVESGAHEAYRDATAVVT